MGVDFADYDNDDCRFVVSDLGTRNIRFTTTMVMAAFAYSATALAWVQ